MEAKTKSDSFMTKIFGLTRFAVRTTRKYNCFFDVAPKMLRHLKLSLVSFYYSPILFLSFFLFFSFSLYLSVYKSQHYTRVIFFIFRAHRSVLRFRIIDNDIFSILTRIIF